MIPLFFSFATKIINTSDSCLNRSNIKQGQLFALKVAQDILKNLIQEQEFGKRLEKILSKFTVILLRKSESIG